MEFRLQDVLEIPRIQSLTDYFFQATGIPTALIDLEGQVITGSGWQPVCTQFHRKNSHSNAICRASDTRFNKELSEGVTRVLYRCPHGLTDAAAPVFIGDTHKANFFTGQFMTHPPDEADYRKFKDQARLYGYDEDAYMAAIQMVPIISEERVESILDFLTELASLLGKSGLVNLRSREVSRQLEERVAERTAEYEKINRALTDEINERIKAEQELQRNQERYQRLIEGSQDIHYSFSPETGGVYFSRQVERYLGYSVEYLQNHPFVWYDSIHPEDKPQFDKAVAGFREGTHFTVEYRIRDKDGNYRWFQDRSIDRMRSGNNELIEGVATDITVQKNSTDILLRERREFFNLLELLPAFVYLQSRDYSIRYSNQRFRQLFGAENVHGTCYEVVAGRQTPCEDCPTFNVFESREPEEWEWTDQKGRIFQIYDYPFLDVDGELLVLEMGIEITRRKHHEEELERFAYVASHDLQEPLRKIISFAELFERRYKSTLDEKADKYIWYIVDAAGRMRDLINDLLEYSRAGRTEIVYSEVDTEAVLGIVLSDMEKPIRECNAEIQSGDLPTIRYKKLHFTQIMQNLISNALKFGRGNSNKIDINAQLVEDEWIFSVSDQGIGIEPRHRDKIFAIFQRLHGRDVPGTGIGLPLVKRIVERHGGRIWFDSVPDKGSTFYFTIPASIKERKR